MTQTAGRATVAHDEILKMAHDFLGKGQYNEALTTLRQLPQDSEEVGSLIFHFEQKRSERRAELLRKAEAASDDEDWRRTEQLLDAARALDPDGRDVRIRQLAEDVARRSGAKNVAEEVAKKRRRAERLLEEQSKRLADIETAIRLLREAISIDEDDFPARALLDKAEALRGDFLASQGQLATLEEVGRIEDALAGVKDMIARGFRGEVNGVDIFEHRAHLETRAREFGEKKAGKYLNEAEEALATDPALALRFIDMGLDLPFVPQERVEDLERLRLKAERARERQQELRAQVQEALRLMNSDRKYEPAIALLEAASVQLPDDREISRHLARAREAHRSQAAQQIRMALARIRTLLTQEEHAAAKSELEKCLLQLDRLGEGEETGVLHGECEELLAEADELGDLLRRSLGAAEEIAGLLKAGDLAAAEGVLGQLDAKLRKRPEIRKLGTALARRQQIGDALEQVRRALDDGDLEGAREQSQALKRRASDHQEVVELHDEVEASFQIAKGRDAVVAGDVKAARRAFKRVVSIDGLYAGEAAESLEQIAEQIDNEKRQRRLYKRAQRQQSSGQFADAWRTLTEIGDDAGFLAQDLVRLKATVAREWRKELVREARAHLKAGSLDAAYQAAGHLEELKTDQDSQLISEVRRAVHVANARSAAGERHWVRALGEWQEAMKLGPADPEIVAGLEEARRRRTLQEADGADDQKHRISLLESAFDPHSEDPDVDHRLAEALILAEETSKLGALATARMNHPSEEIAARARSLRRLSGVLRSAREKLDLEAYAESVGLLESAISAHPDFADPLGELLRKRKQQIVESLLKRARSLDHAGESLTRRVPLYRQILEIEPSHGEAKEHNDMLLEDLSQHVQDLLFQCVDIKDDDDLSEGEIAHLLVEVRTVLKVANQEQSAKLRPQLERLQERRRSLQKLDRVVNQLRGLLDEARETGDFGLVDKILNEAPQKVPVRNSRFVRVAKQIAEVRERRSRASKLAERIEHALAGQDFTALETAAVELQRLDPEDEFRLKKGLRLIDPDTDEALPMSDVAGWAKERRQNFERFEAWLEHRRPDFEELERRESELRREAEQNPLGRELVSGLDRLAADGYRQSADRLVPVPEPPRSSAARIVARDAEDLRRRLLEKAELLEREVRRRREDDARVEVMIEEAGQLLQAREFGAAQSLVEEGLGLAPGHQVLIHFRRVIHDALN